MSQVRVTVITVVPTTNKENQNSIPTNGLNSKEKEESIRSKSTEALVCEKRKHASV